MVSSKIKDLLTSFSPSADFLAITSGDGRIKIWDTLKGQVQTEFADIMSTDETDLLTNSRRGHLSLDYTCMKWCLLENKKKRKLGSSLLVLGTGGGDVLALDVSAGELMWRVNDCHPGGVNAISFSGRASALYTAGVDGMVCQIDPHTGSLLRKFKASTKAISSIAVSPDGKILAIGAAQLRIFNCSDYKKIQKFSGHSVAVRSMIFTEDGKCLLSSAVGERYVAIWAIDGNQTRSASCFLSMEHPAVILDCKGIGGVGLNILAISEIGVCYFWHGKNIKELSNTKPTKISVLLPTSEPSVPTAHRGESKTQISAGPTIFAAKIQELVKPQSGLVFAAFGSLIKPSFDKVLVRPGLDINLNASRDGILLSVKHSEKSQKSNMTQNKVTALDRANAEDALLPIPRVDDIQEKKRIHKMRDSTLNLEELPSNFGVGGKVEALLADDLEAEEKDRTLESMEDRLRSLGILNTSNEEDQNKESYPKIPVNLALPSTKFDDAHQCFQSLLTEADMPAKKIRAAILSMKSSDAYKFLTVLVDTLKSRPGSARYALPWIHGILVNHSSYVIYEDSSTQILETLYEMTKFRCSAVQPLLQLSGRLQLITAQVSADKVNKEASQTQAQGPEMEGSEDEDDEDIDEFVYNESDQYQSASDIDDMQEHEL